MLRSMMQIYVNGSAAAVSLYIRAFNATLGYNVKSGDDSFYHAELDICGHTVAVAESDNADYKRITGNTMQFCFHYGEGNEDKVKHAYEILKVDGEILIQLGPCEFSPLMTDLVDKFGVRWCLFV